jgi:trans-aconitate methyltransferase
MRIFDSGAAAGYLSSSHYEGGLSPGQADAFRRRIRAAFAAQAGEDGRVDLAFQRVYLVAARE